MSASNPNFIFAVVDLMCPKLAAGGRFALALEAMDQIPSESLRNLGNQQYWESSLGNLHLQRAIYRFVSCVRGQERSNQRAGTISTRPTTTQYNLGAVIFPHKRAPS